jgi:hypothetical protein
MAVKKISVSMPADVVDRAREAAGESGLSAFITTCVEQQLRSRNLRKAIDWFEETYGPITAEEEAKADRLFDSFEKGRYADEDGCRADA